MSFQRRVIVCLLLIGSLSLSMAGKSGADKWKTRQELCDNIYLMRSLEAVYRDRENKSRVPDNVQINRLLNIISRQPLFGDSDILPFSDSADIARRIDHLMQRLEQADDAEKAQAIKFNLAYEYLLFYLSFLNEKHLLDFQKDKPELREMGAHQLVSSREMSLYILQAQLYIRSLADYPDGEMGDATGSFQKPLTELKSDVSTTFVARENPEIYLSAGFIAFILECEKLAGQFMLTGAGDTDAVFVTLPSESMVRYFDQRAWNWVNMLWDRYQLASDKPGAGQSKETVSGNGGAFSTYCPSAGTLYRIYRTYLSYHFLWRYVTDQSDDSPLFNSLTRIIFQRLNVLQQDAGLGLSEYYTHYIADCARDGGQSNFMPALFFARRGYFMARAMEAHIDPQTLFDIYGSMFDKSVARVHNNISFRSRIYNELVLFGVRLEALNLMEDRLYDYALMSMRIAPQDDYVGTEFARSSRLTMAYLLASILDAKRLSGIQQGFERYGELAVSLYPLLISSDNHNWKYASMMHYALAMFYSGEKDQQFNESLAMYHARQAFLAPCRKVAMTYGDEKWEQFFSLPAADLARSALELFLYFHNKYPNNPEAIIPEKYNADKIVEKWLKDTRAGVHHKPDKGDFKS